MNHSHHKDPSMMAGLFDKIDPDIDYFSIRHLDMRGRKIEMPSSMVRSSIHCFFFVTSGEAVITIGEDLYCFKSNEYAAIPAGQVFAVRYFDNFTGYMGGFNNEYLNSNIDGNNIIHSFGLLRRWGSHKVCFDVDHSKYICGILDRLYSESINRKNRNIIRAYLTTLLTEIDEASLASNNNVFRTENDICNKYIELVFKYCKYNIPLSEYAQQLNITKGYLLKIVKRLTGKTPLAWITEAIILESKTLLIQTNLAVGQIAFHIGVDDPSYFSRLFKKQTGLTPQQYKDRIKSQNCPL